MRTALHVAPAPAAAAGPVPRRHAVATAAALSLAVAWIHFVYMRSHFDEWWGYGAFFLAAGAGQALFAPLVLRRPAPWLIAGGIAGNLAIVGMYVLTRTSGPPLGPHAHAPERVGLADLGATATEIVLVAVLVSLLAPRARRRVTDLLLAAGIALWILRATGHLP
jgi:hypothetical protein